MTKLLSITAQPDAPVACDMTDAQDTLAERFAEYRRLFEHALVSRSSTDDVTTFRLAARPGVAEWSLDLVRREAACCPYLSYEVDDDGEQIVWSAIGFGGSDMAVLDDFLTGSATADVSSRDMAEDLEARGGVPIIVPAVEG